MLSSRGTLTLCSMLILVCASPAMTHCAKPAQLGSDPMHTMGMKGIVQRNLQPCKSWAEKIYLEGVPSVGPQTAQGSQESDPGLKVLPSDLNLPSDLKLVGSRPPDSMVSPIRPSSETAPGIPLPKARQYLENMFARIVEGTKKKGIRVFEGGLAPERFCFVAHYGESGDAFATPENGLVDVTTGLLQRGSEGEILSVLGHEISHVLLNHAHEYPRSTFSKLAAADAQRVSELMKRSHDLSGQFEEAAKAIGKNFSRTPDSVDMDYLTSEIAGLMKAQSAGALSPSQWVAGAYQIAVKKGFCRQSCADLKQAAEEAATIDRQIGDTRKKLRAIYEKYYSKEEISNKVEVDADELGMELALYAGGSPFYFLDFWYRLLREEDENVQAAVEGSSATSSRQASTIIAPIKESKLTSCLSELGLGKIPARGTESHPSHCWHAYKIKRELEVHPELRQAAKSRPPLQLTNPTLEEVRAEIREAVLTAEKVP